MKTHQNSFSKRDRILVRCLSFGVAIVCATVLVGLIKRQNSASAHSTDGVMVSPAIGLLLTVNSTGDGVDANSGNDGVCSDSNGNCTLRAAIQTANKQSGDDTIEFNIPTSDPGYNSGSWTINLNSALPNLSTNLNINGPGPARNTVTV